MTIVAIYRTRRVRIREHLEDLGWGVLIGLTAWLVIAAILFQISLVR